MNKKFLLPGIVVGLIFLSLTANLYAAPKDLADRFLAKAEKSLQNNDVDKAYDYVNTTLVMAYEDFSNDDEESCKKLISFAQVVYFRKIDQLLSLSYDARNFNLIKIEVSKMKMNINKYPLINNTKIAKGLVDISNALSAVKNNTNVAM